MPECSLPADNWPCPYRQAPSFETRLLPRLYKPDCTDKAPHRPLPASPSVLLKNLPRLHTDGPPAHSSSDMPARPELCECHRHGYSKAMRYPQASSEGTDLHLPPSYPSGYGQAYLRGSHRPILHPDPMPALQKGPDGPSISHRRDLPRR